MAKRYRNIPKKANRLIVKKMLRRDMSRDLNHDAE
jgi:hypothetical protein